MAASDRLKGTLPRTWLAPLSHEDIFIERYHGLRAWALRLTGNRTDADDLLHDAFLQFVLRRRDLSEIGSIDAYLYGILRRLRLSRRRAALRVREDPLDAIDYDTAALSLRGADPRDRIRLRDELIEVCAFACRRKEASKSGSVLLLRFFHGFFPGEIARIVKCPLRGANDWLRLARRETRQHLAHPGRGSRLAHSGVGEGEKAGDEDTLVLLRRMIWRARRGECPSPASLAQTYGFAETDAPCCATLAHLVSCRECLARATALLGMRDPLDRDPHDTLRQDTSWRFGNADRSGGNGSPIQAQLRRWYDALRTMTEHVRPSNAWARLRARLACPATPIWRPAIAMLAVAAAIGVWGRESWRTAPLSAAQILADARDIEVAASSAPLVTTRRVLLLQERRLPDRVVLSSRRIEQWHSAGRQTTARRVYNDRGTLVAAEWTRPDGSRTTYASGQPPRADSAVDPGALTAASVWRLDPSATEFERLVTDVAAASVRDEGDRYVLEYQATLPAGVDGLLQATLVVGKRPLRPIAQTLAIRERGRSTEFHFTESARTELPDGSVPAAAFVPEPELLGPPVVPTVSTAVPAPPAPRPSIDSRVLAEVELDLLLSLHRLESCLDVPADITATKHGISVHVSTASQACREKIRGTVAAKERDGVRAAVSFARRVSHASVSVTATRRELDALPAYRGLLARFAAAGLASSGELSADDAGVIAARAFGTWALEHSHRAYDEVRHLQALAVRWNEAGLDALDVDRVAQWQDVIRDHARRFRRESAALRLQLRSVLPRDEVADSGGVEKRSTDRTLETTAGIVERLATLAAAQHDAVRRLLDPAVVTPEGNADPARLIEMLEESERLASGFDDPWVIPDRTTSSTSLDRSATLSVKAP